MAVLIASCDVFCPKLLGSATDRLRQSLRTSDFALNAWNHMFLGYFYPKNRCFLFRKKNDFRGDLTDVSAKPATLLHTMKPVYPEHQLGQPIYALVVTTWNNASKKSKCPVNDLFYSEMGFAVCGAFPRVTGCMDDFILGNSSWKAGLATGSSLRSDRDGPW